MPITRLVVEADGGSRGNPGVAGYGALVRDPATGRVLAERAAPLGTASNNVAEYSGLVAGLEAALHVGGDDPLDIEVRMDSKLVVEQMAGRWKIKHEDMRRLALTAREVVRRIEANGGRVGYTWIPREINKDADALSNDGMDGLHVVRDHERAPSTTASSAATPTAEQTLEQTLEQDLPELNPSTGFSVPDLGEPTRILLVRHGVTRFTEEGRLDGRGGFDPPLSPSGQRQAAAAAEAVAALVGAEPVTVITSSLQRARQTGAAIAAALGVEPIEDADWDEQNFGDWDGEAFGDLYRTVPDELMAFRRDPTYRRPGGEAMTEVSARVTDALQRALKAGGPGGTVVVASHRKPILSVLGGVLRLPDESFWTIATAPASITGLQVWADGNVSIPFTNRTDHLET